MFMAVVCAGFCDEAGREHEHAASDNVDPRVAAVEAEIGKCRQMLDVGGWNAAIWSSSVAKSILALDDAGQQKRLVDAYLAHLAALDPLTDAHKAISTSLFNYSMMLDAYLLLYKFPDAEEKLFGLMCRCIRLYRTEINNLTVEVEGKPASRHRLDLKHERMCMTGILRCFQTTSRGRTSPGRCHMECPKPGMIIGGIRSSMLSQPPTLYQLTVRKVQAMSGKVDGTAWTGRSGQGRDDCRGTNETTGIWTVSGHSKRTPECGGHKH